MKIFISWSGTRSKHIAEALYWWIPNVIQAAKPFISAQDIRKGARGAVVIAERLKDSDIGIICITPENQKSEWIQFEAGALSNLPNAHVCTVLYEVSPGEMRPPLGQFQHTELRREEIRDLLITLNDRLGEQRLEEKRLDEAFDVWWPRLEEEIKKTPQRADNEPIPEKRTAEDKMDEILELLRKRQTDDVAPRIAVLSQSENAYDALHRIASKLPIQLHSCDLSANQLKVLLKDDYVRLYRSETDEKMVGLTLKGKMSVQLTDKLRPS